MEPIHSEIEQVVDDIKDYVHINVELIKLKTTEKGVIIASTLLVNLLLGVCVFLAILFLSFAAAFGIAETTGKIYLGFLIVGGFYILVGIVMLMTKDKWLKNTFIDNIIKSVYNS